MNAQSSRKSFAARLQEKLAASRFFTFSMLLHIILVVSAGGIVLVKHMDAQDDFRAPGGLFDPTAQVQAPQDDPIQPEQQTFEPSEPSLTPPPLSVNKTTTPTPTQMKLAHVPISGPKPVSDQPLALNKPVATSAVKNLPPSHLARIGGKAREEAMRKFSMEEKSEKAVMAGLRWLKQNQNADGSWSSQHQPAMTGLALLCFLGHGELPESPEFGANVRRGLDWLLAKGAEFEGRMSLTRDGFTTQPSVYEHAIATYAMGEYFTMTRDERFAELLRQAVGYIVNGQAPDGGWQYNFAKGPDSDTSVAGWQIQALKAAQLTGLDIPGVHEALDNATLNLKRVQSANGNFGYRKAGDRGSNPNLAGVGVLCTYFVKQDKDKVVKDGLDFLLKRADDDFPVKYRGEKADLYAWYYHTQACLMYGGAAWSKWNRMFQGEIAGAQSPDGSWPPTGNPKPHGPEIQPGGAGPVYRTTLCVLMLEVFYRNIPTTK